MDKIDYLLEDPQIISMLGCFESRHEQLIELIIGIQQIPAPTFAEEERAIFVEARFEKIGLKEVFRDELNNVYGKINGTHPSDFPSVVLTAHLDTVFSAETDLSIKRSGPYLFGPGIGDNSTGVAGLIHLAELFLEFNIKPKADLWFVCNVGEEGMGNLRGMRAVVSRFPEQVQYIVIEGGLYGQINHQAIGVKRFQIEVTGPGGHSWGSFGQTSAIHEIGQLISDIDSIQVPARPKTTYNVGVVNGGTTINSIASFASILLDLRSEDRQNLEQLVDKVFSIVENRQRMVVHEGQGIAYKIIEVGNRPAGAIGRNHELVKLANKALVEAGCPSVSYIVGSTDANIPLSLGIPTVCVGLTISGKSHRLDEFIEPAYLPVGMRQLLILTLAAAGLE